MVKLPAKRTREEEDQDRDRARARDAPPAPRSDSKTDARQVNLERVGPTPVESTVDSTPVREKKIIHLKRHQPDAAATTTNAVAQPEHTKRSDDARNGSSRQSVRREFDSSLRDSASSDSTAAVVPIGGGRVRTFDAAAGWDDSSRHSGIVVQRSPDVAVTFDGAAHSGSSTNGSSRTREIVLREQPQQQQRREDDRAHHHRKKNRR